MRSTDDIRILLNPSSARGTAAASLPRLEAAGRVLAAPIEVTESGAGLRQAARRAVEDGVDRLVVAGGDGSFHLVAQELAGSDCALVPVARGRGNDLATCLGVKPIPEALEEWIADGPIRRVDLGRAGEVVFGVHCGVGFDSEAARWANSQRVTGGILSYPLAVFRTLLTFTPPRLRVEYPEGVFEGEAMFVVCANCWRFGGGMKIAPEALLDDGLLDVVIVRRVSRLVALRLFARVYSGRHVGHPAVTLVRSSHVEISLDRRMEMYGDGEAMLWVDETPLEVKILPGALKVVAPPPAAARPSGGSEVELDPLRQG